MKTTIIKERLQSVLIAILFISVFLPFGLNHFGWLRWALIGGLGIIISLCVLTSELIVEKLFRMPNDVLLGSQYIIKQLEEAQLLNGMLQERQRHYTKEEPKPQSAPTADNDDVVCISGATKESLEVRPSDVVFATSEGNYVRVHYINNGNEHNMLIRTSMKNVADLLCRHSYIMQYGEESVLVSKQYASEVKERIKNPLTVA